MGVAGRKVVITGAGLATPGGYTLDENYAAARAGKGCFTEITRFSTAGSSVRYAGDCPEPDVKKLPDRKIQKIVRRKDVISLLTCLDVAQRSGLTKGVMDPERVGMYVGAGSTQIGDLTPYFILVSQCADVEGGTFDSASFGQKLMDLVNPLVVLQNLMNNALCYGTMTLDIRGVNSNFMDFHVAGLRAVGEGYRSIAQGRCDAALCGGVAGPVEPFQLAEGVESGYLARTKDVSLADIGGIVKPFDKRRQGAIMSEGSGFVYLEEEQHALKRGAPILGRVTGFALASDGSIDLIGEPYAPAIGRCLDMALREAGHKPTDLGLLVGHANGSLFGDGAEARAYAEFLGAHAAKLPLYSPKSVFGDLSEASGMLGLILALDAMAKGEVAATHNFAVGDDYSKQLSVKAEPQAVKQKRAAVTARNFLGLSTALVIEAP
jgi:3-oxoacyl-[acyl-carrier-protein] synthase II